MQTTFMRELTPSQAAQLEPIYTGAFPPSERGSFDALVESIRRGERECCLGLEGETVAAAAVLIDMTPQGFYFLEYLMTAESRRGQGLGSAMLAALEQALTQRGARGLLLEVESERAGSEAERELRQRRIAFYRRSGFELVEALPYHHAPDLSQPGQPLEMRLMWRAYPGGPERLEGERLKRLVRLVYTRSYGLPAASEYEHIALAQI